MGPGTKTKKMLAVESELGAPLIEALPDMVTQDGMSKTADRLGVSKATLGYWLLKLDIVVRRVAIAPGETITIHRTGRDRKTDAITNYAAD